MCQDEETNTVRNTVANRSGQCGVRGQGEERNITGRFSGKNIPSSEDGWAGDGVMRLIRCKQRCVVREQTSSQHPS